MGGVFVTNKEFYGLKKIRVKGDKREKFAIFFGIMAANAVNLAKRKAEAEGPLKKTQPKNTTVKESVSACQCFILNKFFS